MKILFSPVGGTDPMSEYNYYDGALIHIARHYRPDIIYMYMSKEILENEIKDHRYTYCVKRLGQDLNHEFEVKIIERPELTEVQKFELIFSEFDDELSKLTENLNKEDELLLNISSGTPAMKSALLVIATMVDIPCKCIQVKTPMRQMNQHIHDLKGEYDPEIRWELNPDNHPNELDKENRNRTSEEKLISLKRLKYEAIIQKEVEGFHYKGALKLAEELNPEYTKGYLDKIRLAAAREKLDFRLLDELLKKTEVNQEIYSPVRQQERRLIYEYALALQATVRKGESSDFIRRITPLLLNIFESILQSRCAFNVNDYVEHNRAGTEIWNMEKLTEEHPEGRKESYIDILNKCYGMNFQGGWIKSDHLVKLIEELCKDEKVIQCVETLRAIEGTVRNLAAHEMDPVSDEYIRKETINISNDHKGYDSERIMNLIKDAFHYTAFNIRDEQWNSYDRMNEDIIASIRQAD